MEGHANINLGDFSKAEQRRQKAEPVQRTHIKNTSQEKLPSLYQARHQPTGAGMPFLISSFGTRAGHHCPARKGGGTLPTEYILWRLIKRENMRVQVIRKDDLTRPNDYPQPQNEFAPIGESYYGVTNTYVQNRCLFVIEMDGTTKETNGVVKIPLEDIFKVIEYPESNTESDENNG